MPHRTWHFSEGGLSAAESLSLFGPRLRVEVAHPARNLRLGLEAVIDTGSSYSLIDEQVARSLSLPGLDRLDLPGLAGSRRCTLYACRIALPDIDATAEAARALGVRDLAALDPQKPFSFVLGRQQMRERILIYNGRCGEVTVTG